MQRRKLVATAGAVSVTAFAATLAIGANFGLAGRAEPDSPVGRLDPTATSVRSVVADDATVAPVAPTPSSTVPADD